MKLGLQLGYWGAQPPQGVGELVAAAEDAGFDAIFTAEAWGSDAFTPLAWWGRETSRMRLGTSIVQMSGRTPTSIAMHALTLDHLSGGRVVLGMGVSGPQVVEGWYGQPFAKPLARTREVVDIIRQVLAREAPVTNDGPHYPLPYTGEGVGRARQAAEADRAPAARRHPDLARRRGPEERRPDRRDRRRLDPDLLHAEVGRACTSRGSTRGSPAPGARRTRADFEIAATCHLQITSSAEERQARHRRAQARRSRSTWAAWAPRSRTSTRTSSTGWATPPSPTRCRSCSSPASGSEATALIPDELVEEMHIVGDAGYVKERVAAVGGDRRDHAAAQPALGRRGPADRRDAGVSEALS